MIYFSKWLIWLKIFRQSPFLQWSLSHWQLIKVMLSSQKSWVFLSHNDRGKMKCVGLWWVCGAEGGGRVTWCIMVFKNGEVYAQSLWTGNKFIVNLVLTVLSYTRLFYCQVSCDFKVTFLPGHSWYIRMWLCNTRTRPYPLYWLWPNRNSSLWMHWQEAQWENIQNPFCLQTLSYKKLATEGSVLKPNSKAYQLRESLTMRNVKCNELFYHSVIQFLLRMLVNKHINRDT